MKKSKNPIITKIAVGAVSLLIGIGLGELIVSSMGRENIREMSAGVFILYYTALIALLLVAYLIQTVIHEAGHLAFGLATGYKFLSFRVGSLTLVQNEDGSRSLKRFSLAGTLGQCLLCPPDMDGGKYPYVLYNLGGVIMNLIASAVFLLLWLPAREIPVLSTFLLELIAAGVMIAIFNGVPMETASVPNDGHNALNIGKSPDSLRAFWLQLKINELQTRGVRPKDMPEEWFALPESLDNSMLASLAANAEARMMDAQDFASAEALFPRLLDGDTALTGIHRSLITLDRVFCDIIENGAEADTSRAEEKEIKSFMASMKNYPAVLRTKYAIALAKGEKEEAEKTEAAFQKAAETYAIPSDIESEKELMERVKERFAEK